MDIFFFQLAVVFLPGLIWERIVTKYGLKRAPTQFETILRTFTFGLTAYAITYMIYLACGHEFLIPEVRKDSAFIGDRRLIAQFALACLVALIGAVLWLYGFTYKWVGRLLRRIGATKKYGDENLWDYLLNSSDARVEYAYVRDYENEKVFSGWIVGFSETDSLRELLMRDVEVYDLEGTLLYVTPLTYISRPADAMHLEFPVKTEEAKDGTGTN